MQITVTQTRPNHSANCTDAVSPPSAIRYTETITSEPWLDRQFFHESEMALFSECMPECARIVLDTADIVREAMLRQQSRTFSVFDPQNTWVRTFRNWPSPGRPIEFDH